MCPPICQYLGDNLYKLKFQFKGLCWWVNSKQPDMHNNCKNDILKDGDYEYHSENFKELLNVKMKKPWKTRYPKIICQVDL